MSVHRLMLRLRTRRSPLRAVLPAALVVGALMLLGNWGSREAVSSTLPPVGWSQGPSLPAGFTPRWDFAYAAFPSKNEVVLFGGAPTVAAEPWHNDTWIYQDGAWRQGPDAPAGLTVRGGAAMAYDPDLDQLVLFGGSGGQWPPYNDTWLFDGNAWTPGPDAPSGLAGRVGARMAYDAKIGKIVLFGGSGVQPYNDTWLFDGSRWTAGPATPSNGPSARTSFAMAYDAATQNVVMTGGNGGGDLWNFDGTAWVRGADMPADFTGAERVSMAYDPQLGGMIIFGGLGGTAGQQEFHLYRGGQWMLVPKDIANPIPAARLDAAYAWIPEMDAFMMFSGVQDLGKDESAGFGDSWFFRDVPPAVASVTLSPTDPDMTDAVTLTTGALQGGYKTWTYDYEWYVNGVKVAGLNDKKLTPALGGYVHGDTIYARARVHDALGIYGPWVSSSPITVRNRPPTLSKATLGPTAAYDITTLRATSTGSDPDGDAVVFHYTWTVNSSVVANNDKATLTPDLFKAGDVVGLTTKVTDAVGLDGNSKTATPLTIRNSLVATNNAPGKPVKFTGKGFKAGENVEIRVDTTTGVKMGTITAASDGSFAKSINLPTPFPGGKHSVFGVGLSSGLVGPATMKVTPTGSISQVRLAVGDHTTYAGMGFVPGEQVSVQFPGATATVATADSTGSVSLNLASPPEPFPGGTLIATAPSGQTTNSYTVASVFTMQTDAEPLQSVPIVLTGYGPSETVALSFDAGPASATFVTDASGSLSANLLLATTFGNHTVTALGQSSAQQHSTTIHLPQFMTLSPTSGPAGTTITIDSGPGWIPGETVHFLKANTVVKNVVADANGSIHTTYTIPTTQGAGDVVFHLTSDTLGITASATFTVTS